MAIQKRLIKGSAVLELAEQISKSLAKESIAFKANGEIQDLARIIDTDISVEILKKSSDEALDIIRHDCAHVMADGCSRIISRHTSNNWSSQ